MKAAIEACKSGIAELRERVWREMTPDMEGERELSDEEFDFDWVFQTLMKTAGNWYAHFYPMRDLALKRGVPRDRLMSDFNNIFDNFED